MFLSVPTGTSVSSGTTTVMVVIRPNSSLMRDCITMWLPDCLSFSKPCSLRIRRILRDDIGPNLGISQSNLTKGCVGSLINGRELNL